MVDTCPVSGVIDHYNCFFFLTSKVLFKTANTKKKGKEKTIA
jgi:hypothetical protein